MTRSHRRTHLWAWLLLTPLMLALIVVAVIARKVVPAQAQSSIAPVQEPSR